MTALAQNVLVLNRSFAAVRVVSAKVAFLLLFRGAAEVVHVEGGGVTTYTIDSWIELSTLRELFEDEGSYVRTVRFDIRIPHVIRLLRVVAPRWSRVPFNRRNILLRDGLRCQYCGRVLASRELTFDHVIPRCRGGTTSWENIVAACLRCNHKKNDRVPAQAGMRLIRPPREPAFLPAAPATRDRAVPASWRYFVDEAYWGVILEE